MQLLMYLSDFLIPVLIFYIIGFGLLSKVPVFDSFAKGAKDGLTVAKTILPTLIGLMMGVGILRASGFLDWFAQILQHVTDPLHVPAALVPVIFVRILSSSAATGLVLDIFKEFGADSYNGYAASILLSCTETVFYTMSIYFLAAGVKKTRYTLPGALLATAAGVVVSLWLAKSL